MMKKLKILSLLAISLLMSSCVVYSPMMTDVPLISKKNDLRVDGGLSYVLSAHGTVSYGLTDNIAVQAFGSYSADDEKYYQGSVGWYKNLGNNRIFEWYGGMGYGEGDAFNSSTGERGYKGHYHLYFTQLNYGVVKKRIGWLLYDTGIGLKTGYLHSNLMDYTPLNYRYKGKPKPPKEPKPILCIDKSILIEPIGFFRFGTEELKINLQVGINHIIKFTHKDKEFPYYPLNLGVGINLHF